LVARVLVVDDESDIRQAVAEILADEGYQVAGASDGEEALAKVRAFHPQVVLLDLMMPGMSGWDFLRAQQGDPELRGIPVIVLSALGGERGVDAKAFIEKPFDLEELLTTVRLHAFGEA
jgi:CheY-like chemotaxis protein